MEKPSNPVISRPGRRSFFPAFAVAVSSASLAFATSCGNPSQHSSDGLTAGSTASGGGTTMPGAIGGPISSDGSHNLSGAGTGAPITPGGQSPASGAVTGGPGAVAAGPGSGAQGTGGASPGGVVTPVDMGTGNTGNAPATPAEPAPEGGGSGATSVAEPCEDVLPPPDPEWPDATCERWAAETEECSADWFAPYCDVSCGRCVPEAGGSGGMSSVPEPEPCEDILPPPDPEWPDANCETWALETPECDAAWFSDYCDISCGRCIPEGGSPLPTAPDCSGEGLPNVTGGEGFATRYWDCCQTHCSQQTGHRCSQDGVSGSGDQNSACAGGGSYACYDEAPRAVSECLSYGHIAKTNPNCGGCYRIQFTGQGEHNPNDAGSRLIAGKQMIVKVTNTGGDVAGNQFDLMVPGGGVGQFNACSQQWGTSDLGAQYGGFLAECSGTHAEKKECVRQECMKIPAGSARDGCIWFVDWFEVADNPKFTSQASDCPF